MWEAFLRSPWGGRSCLILLLIPLLLLGCTQIKGTAAERTPRGDPRKTSRIILFSFRIVRDIQPIGLPYCMSVGKAPLTRAHPIFAIILAIYGRHGAEKCAIHTSYITVKLYYRHCQGRSATLKSAPTSPDRCDVSASRVQYNGCCRVGNRPYDFGRACVPRTSR